MLSKIPCIITTIMPGETAQSASTVLFVLRCIRYWMAANLLCGDGLVISVASGFFVGMHSMLIGPIGAAIETPMTNP